MVIVKGSSRTNLIVQGHMQFTTILKKEREGKGGQSRLVSDRNLLESFRILALGGDGGNRSIETHLHIETHLQESRVATVEVSPNLWLGKL